MGLDPDLLARCRAAYVDPAPPLSPAVWERIRGWWVPAYQATAADPPPAAPARAA